MAIQRFFGNFDFSEKEIGKKIEISDKNIIHQIKNVLRLKIGDEIVLCDGKSNEAVSKIIDSPIVRFAEDSAKRSGNKDSLSLEIVKVFKNNNESEKDIILYCSILKKENFELVVQKAVEIGVKEIIPIITKRTVKLNLKSGGGLGCSSQFRIPSLGISKNILLNGTTEVNFTPSMKGKLVFTCSMGMYSGVIEVL